MSSMGSRGGTRSRMHSGSTSPAEVSPGAPWVVGVERGVECIVVRLVLLSSGSTSPAEVSL